jgi:beta-lactamase regulating signal transducer with metallopeptidase domain
MNAYLPFGDVAWWQVAAWTMLHFLWLGTLVGLAAVACRFAMRHASAETRYAASLACLVVLAALPVGIAAWLVAEPFHQPLPPAASPQLLPLSPAANHQLLPLPPGEGRGEGDTPQPAEITASASAPASATPAPRDDAGKASAALASAAAILEACVPYLPWLWLVGTPITLALLATGVVGTGRLRRDSRALEEGPIAEACERLARSLRISRQVAVAVCERIAAPVLVGILRPIVLLPPAALTGWSPDEIEMVLLHELAHVRRWDNLVNFVQRLVESLLFFHPAVWLLSGSVRREREACCDAVVVAQTNRPHAYAEMLVALAAQMPRSVLFQPAASSAMAAGRLRGRIRRILQLEDDPMLISGKSFAIMLAGLLVAATLALLYLPTIGQAEEATAELGKSPTEGWEKAEAAPTPAKRALFPSLEDQKLANLVWKMLQVELVPIGEEDLKRVQALGYDGGLIVIAAVGLSSEDILRRSQLSKEQQLTFALREDYKMIQAGDILVGLHVWPTTSLNSLAKVFDRDDLAELNPLKFYVVRQEQVGGSPANPVFHDVVRTGRVSVDVGTGRSEMGGFGRMGMAMGGMGGTPAATQDAAQPQAAGVNKANLRYDGKSFDEWSTAWQTELSTEKRIEAVKALAAFGRAGYGKEASAVILDVAGTCDFFTIPGSLQRNVEQHVIAELAPNPPGRHSMAEHWLPDLAARLEKEPKKWTNLSLHLLFQLQTDDPAAIAVLQSLAQTGPEDVRPAALRAFIRSSRARNPGGQIDDKTRDLLTGALKSNDPALVQAAIGALLYYPPDVGGMGGGGFSPQPQLMFQPELVPLLFHPNEAVRQQSLGVFRYIDEKDAPQVVEQLTAILKDESRKPDHLHAIRGLAAMGAKARPAVDTLRPILASNDDALRITAAVALRRMLNQPEYFKVLVEALGDKFNIQLSGGDLQLPPHPKQQEYNDNDFNDAVQAEEKQLFGE